jgi:hypothetical protein
MKTLRCSFGVLDGHVQGKPCSKPCGRSVVLKERRCFPDGETQFAYVCAHHSRPAPPRWVHRESLSVREYEKAKPKPE